MYLSTRQLQQGEKSRKMETAIHAEPSADLNPPLLASFDMLRPTGSEFAATMFNRLYKDKPEE